MTPQDWACATAGALVAFLGVLYWLARVAMGGSLRPRREAPPIKE